MAINHVVSVQGRDAGKFYFEVRVDDHYSLQGPDGDKYEQRPGSNLLWIGPMTGIVENTAFFTGVGITPPGFWYINGQEYSIQPEDNTPHFTIGDSTMFALDFEANPGFVRIYAGANGTWAQSHDEDGIGSGFAGDPAAGTHWFTELPAETFYAAAMTQTDGFTVTLAELSAQMLYAVPSGFESWRSA